jgi:hypothetical protein
MVHATRMTVFNRINDLNENAFDEFILAEECHPFYHRMEVACA